MLVIQFRSDYYSTGRGFSLQFSSIGHDNSEYEYKLRHVSDIQGTVEYDDGDIRANQLHVIALSLDDPVHTGPSLPISIDWKGGILRKAVDSCTYDSMAFYEPVEASNGNWLMQKQYPDLHYKSCPNVETIDEEKYIFVSE